MKHLWHQLREDESGFLISSELVIIGTIGVLAMVVGMEAISSSVIQELNDLASAFGAFDQSFSVRSIWKFGHARVRGFGFNDTTDFCDCIAISQTDVVGKTCSGFGGPESISTFGPGVFQGSGFSNGASEIVVEPARPVPFVAPCVGCPNSTGQIIEERILPQPEPPSSGRGSIVPPRVPTPPKEQ